MSDQPFDPENLISRLSPDLTHISELQDTLAKSGQERVHRESTIAAAAELSMRSATDTASVLIERIQEFEAELKANEEVTSCDLATPLR